MSYYLNDSEIVAALSLREFQRLCALVDEFSPVTAVILQHGGGSNEHLLKGRLLTRQFRVIRVQRTEKRILVLLEFSASAFGKVHRDMYELVPEDKMLPVAPLLVPLAEEELVGA